MINIRFFDLEITDGYFSGVIIINLDNNVAISREFGYDIEFKNLRFFSCREPKWQMADTYDEEDIEDVIMNHYTELEMSVINKLNSLERL